MATPFPEDQVRALVILERVGGSLSLLALTAVFLFFTLLPRLRTVPNTFIIFASIADGFSAIACLVAYDGVYQGQTSPLCQLQGFMFEMFTQVNAWLSLAMAINLLLIFLFKAEPRTLNKWSWLSCFVCFGGPFGLALTCLLVAERGQTPVYGNVGAWCWISEDWNTLRIYTCYMLVWGCLLTSVIIYAVIGLRAPREKEAPSHQSVSHSRTPSSLTSPGLTAFLISSTPGRSPSPSICNASIHEAAEDGSEQDKMAKRAHLRTALLFTLSVMLPWLLTSIHRVFEIATGRSPFPLHVLSATVMPLQGTLTACVFLYTNWTAVREGVADLTLPRSQTQTQARSRPARGSKTVYSMWRDASPSSHHQQQQRDSWDFLDIGIDDQARPRGLV